MVTEKKKNPNFVFNLTVGKNVDLYKSTPLNSKTEETFQEALQEQGIYQVCGEYNRAKIDTQKGHISHSGTASKSEQWSCLWLTHRLSWVHSNGRGT